MFRAAHFKVLAISSGLFFGDEVVADERDSELFLGSVGSIHCLSM